MYRTAYAENTVCTPVHTDCQEEESSFWTTTHQQQTNKQGMTPPIGIPVVHDVNLLISYMLIYIYIYNYIPVGIQL